MNKATYYILAVFVLFFCISFCITMLTDNQATIFTPINYVLDILAMYKG